MAQNRKLAWQLAGCQRSQRRWGGTHSERAGDIAESEAWDVRVKWRVVRRVWSFIVERCGQERPRQVIFLEVTRTQSLQLNSQRVFEPRIGSANGGLRGG